MKELTHQEVAKMILIKAENELPLKHIQEESKTLKETQQAVRPRWLK